MQKDWQIPQNERRDFFLKKSKWAVLIPVLDEGERIVRQSFQMQSYINLADIFIVDGSSTDQALTDTQLTNFNVRGFLKNLGPRGLGAQLRIGLAAILNDGYDGVILIDGNGKDNVTAIPLFVKKLEQGYDHVQGSRFIAGGVHKNTPWLRWLAIRWIHAPLLSLASRHWMTDTTNGFRAYSRKFLQDPRVQPFRDCFVQYELHYYLTIQAARLGFLCGEIPVERTYPATGQIPTKIKGFGGYFSVIKALIKVCLGKYNP